MVFLGFLSVPSAWVYCFTGCWHNTCLLWKRRLRWINQLDSRILQRKKHWRSDWAHEHWQWLSFAWRGCRIRWKSQLFGGLPVFNWEGARVRVHYGSFPRQELRKRNRILACSSRRLVSLPLHRPDQVVKIRVKPSTKKLLYSNLEPRNGARLRGPKHVPGRRQNPQSWHLLSAQIRLHTDVHSWRSRIHRSDERPQDFTRTKAQMD